MIVCASPRDLFVFHKYKHYQIYLYHLYVHASVYLFNSNLQIVQGIYDERPVLNKDCEWVFAKRICQTILIVLHVSTCVRLWNNATN